MCKKIQWVYVKGRNYIRIGSSRTYHAFLRVKDLEEDVVPDRISWSYIAPDGVSVESDQSKATITVPENKKIVGEMITLFAVDPNEQYGRCGYEIEVTL